MQRKNRCMLSGSFEIVLLTTSYMRPINLEGKRYWMRDIPGFEGHYKIDEMGNVFSKTGYKRKPRYHHTGYLNMNLSKHGKVTTHYIHRLVALTYIDNPNGFKEVNHINRDKFDNRVLNLEWCTNAMNLEHARRTGLRNDKTRNYQEVWG